jgi:hypothetical protein
MTDDKKPNEVKPKEWPIKYVRYQDMHDSSIARDKFPMISVGAVNWLKQENTSLRESLKLAIEAVSRCMFELDKCTNGHVVDLYRRDLAIEAYKYGREALATIKAKHGEL